MCFCFPLLASGDDAEDGDHKFRYRVACGGGGGEIVAGKQQSCPFFLLRRRAERVSGRALPPFSFRPLNLSPLSLSLSSPLSPPKTTKTQFFPGVYCAVYDCSSKLEKPPPNPENDPYCKVIFFLFLRRRIEFVCSSPPSLTTAFCSSSNASPSPSVALNQRQKTTNNSTTTSSCSSSRPRCTLQASSRRFSRAPFAASPGAGPRSRFRGFPSAWARP